MNDKPETNYDLYGIRDAWKAIIGLRYTPLSRKQIVNVGRFIKKNK